MNFSELISGETLPQLFAYAVSFCKNLVVACVVFFIGKWIICHLMSLVVKAMRKKKVEASLFSFIRSIVSVSLYLVLGIVIIGILGIETSSFIALFASAGMAIGMALSGTLQNFAGGVMILLFKPFKVGHYIEAQGYAGTVKEIQIFNTILTTVDNQTIIIPNGGLSTGSMKNYSTEPNRRVDISFSFAYGTDFETVKAELSRIQYANPLILKDPAPWIGITSLGESGVTVQTRSWCKSADYWTVAGYMNETVYQQLKDKGYMFPFNKLDVTVVNNKQA
jgi:small conductance mechanosensitive channel